MGLAAPLGRTSGEKGRQNEHASHSKPGNRSDVSELYLRSVQPWQLAPTGFRLHFPGMSPVCVSAAGQSFQAQGYQETVNAVCGYRKQQLVGPSKRRQHGAHTMTAAESDLRGEVALAVMAYLTWAEFHGGATPLLNGTVDRWLTAGKPDDPQIARALTNTRRALDRYVGHSGRTPEWFPASLLEALNAPCTDTQSAATKSPSPSENATTPTDRHGQFMVNPPQERPGTKRSLPHSFLHK